MTYYFLCYHPPLDPPPPKPPPPNQPPELHPNQPPKPPPPHHLPPPGRLFIAGIFPVEKAQSAVPKTPLATRAHTIPIKSDPINNHIATPPRMAPKIIPGHQALEDSKKLFPKNMAHQKRNIKNEIQIPATSFGGSGRVTTSPLRTGIITSTADKSHAPYSHFLKAGVRYSSIILAAIRSVITPSNPRPTSILT